MEKASHCASFIAPEGKRIGYFSFMTQMPFHSAPVSRCFSVFAALDVHFHQSITAIQAERLIEGINRLVPGPLSIILETRS